MIIEQFKLKDSANNEGLLKVIAKDIPGKRTTNSEDGTLGEIRDEDRGAPPRVFFTARVVVKGSEQVLGIMANYAAGNFAEYQHGREEFLINVKRYSRMKGYQIVS